MALNSNKNSFRSNVKNFIINGNMNVFQSKGPLGSTAITSGAIYGLDQWVMSVDGTGATLTMSQQAFTLGQPDVPGEPEYFLRMSQTGTISGQTLSRLSPRIEDARTLAGQDSVFSFWAKADAARTITVFMRQYFGTGGSPSAVVDSSSYTIDLTTTWQPFFIQHTWAGISGKTLGSDNNDWISPVFNLPVNTAYTIDVAQAQLEAGSEFSGFETKTLEQDLHECMRYYQKSFPYSVAVASNAGQSGAVRAPVINVIAGGALYSPTYEFKTKMRAQPVMTFYNPSAAGNDAYNVLATGNNNVVAGSTAVSGQLSEDSFAFNATIPNPATNWGAGQFVTVHYTADARL